jgi:hypothetical protein
VDYRKRHCTEEFATKIGDFLSAVSAVSALSVTAWPGYATFGLTLSKNRNMTNVTVAQAGRAGGLARAAKLSPARRSEIGRLAIASRNGTKRGYPSHRQFTALYVQRLAEYDHALAWVIDKVSRAPLHIAQRLPYLLDESAVAALERALADVAVSVERKICK